MSSVVVGLASRGAVNQRSCLLFVADGLQLDLTKSAILCVVLVAIGVSILVAGSWRLKGGSYKGAVSVGGPMKVKLSG